MLNAKQKRSEFENDVYTTLQVCGYLNLGWVSLVYLK